MTSELRRRIDRLLALSVMLFIAVGCGQTNGCSCGVEAEYPDDGLLVKRSMQVRLTPQGIDSLESAVVPLLAEQLGGGMGGQMGALSFCLPSTTGSPSVCYQGEMCDDGSAGCQLDLGLDSIEIEPQDNGAGEAGSDPADALRAVINVNEFDEVLSVGIDFLGTQNCRVELSLPDNELMVLTADLALPIDPMTDRMSIEYLGSDLNIDNLDVNLSGWGGFNLLCSAANLGTGLIKDQLTGQLDPTIKSALDGFLCTPCEEMTNACPSGSMCDTDTGLCMVTDEQCLAAPIGAEGAVDLGDLLSGFGSGEPALLYYSLFPGNYADAVNSGLSLGVETGMTSEYDPCVPMQPPPDGSPIDRSTVVEADTTPAGNNYDIGIGVSENFLEQAMWAAYNNGGLCIEVGSDTVPQLTTGTLSLLLMSLGDLTGGEQRPVLIKLQPKQAPTVALGAGTIGMDENGEPVLEEPLITIELDNIDIDIYAFVFDRYARLLTVNTDISIPIGLTLTPNNELIPLIDDIGLDNTEVRNSEILSDDPEQLASLLPGLIASFLPALTGSLAEPIELPDLMGFQLEIQELSGIENNTMLGLFANLNYMPSGMLGAAADTEAYVTSIETPARQYVTSAGEIDWSQVEDPKAVRPIVMLELDGTSPNGTQLEYTYRVDGSLWNLYSTNTTRHVDHPSLVTPGRHVIEVQAREVGNHRTADPTPAELEVVIDWMPPTVQEIQVADTTARVQATDDVAFRSELRYRYRVRGEGSDGTWSDWSTSNAFDLANYAGSRVKLDIEVRDGSGNVGKKLETLSVAGVKMDKPIDEDPTGCACSTTRRDTDMPLGGAIAALLLAGVFLWRRRWSGFAVMLAVLATAGLNTGCDDNAASSECEECPEGTSCVDGECLPDNACTDDMDCPDGQTCDNGMCTAGGCMEDADCTATCDDGSAQTCTMGVCGCGTPCDGSCGDGEFCCVSEDMCRALPDECGEMTCEPGFTAEVTGPAMGDPNTCEVTDPVCECVELDPLRTGRYGLYSNIAGQEGGTVAISAYNSTYGDLMLGVVAADGSTDWSFVEGVPADGDITGKIDGPRGGIADQGANVGRYSDIAVGADGSLHISYQDVDNEALRYALGTPDGNGGYTWAFHNVDEDGRTGFWTSISLDEAGAPGIAYMVLERDDAGTTVSELRYAQASSAAPAANTDWALATLVQLDISGPCGMSCADGSFCRLDTTSCEAAVDAMECGDSCAEDERCFTGGTCATIQLESELVDWEPGVGLHTQQARFSDGRVAVVSYDSINGNGLLSLEVSDGMFDTSIIAGEAMDGTDTGNIGLWPSVAVDDSDNVHVTYVDWNKKDLLYADLAAGTGEVVDDGARVDAFGPSLNFVGDDASIWIVNGVPTITYQDSTSLQLVLAQQDGSGSFIQTVVAGEGRDSSYEGAFGFYADHVVLNGMAWMVNFVVNQQAAPPTFTPVVHSATIQ